MMLFSGTYAASNAGDWLDIAPDARSVGMGGSQVAVANDAFAPYWNPAGIYKKYGFAASNSNIFGLVNYNYGSYIHTFDFGSLGISYLSSGVDGIKSTTYASGRPVDSGSTFEATNMAIMLSYATSFQRMINLINKDWDNPITDSLKVGMNIKYISHKISTYSATGIGIDMGLQYSIYDRVFIGAAIYNRIPVKLSWNNNIEEEFPKKSKLGLGWSVFDNFLLVADWKYEGYKFKNITVGAEYVLFDSIAVRIGGNRDYYSAGIGINVYGLKIDTAYTIQTPAYDYMDPSIRVSISY